MLKISTTYPRATKVLERYKKYVISQAKANLTRKGVKSKSLHSSLKGYVDKKFNRGVGGKFLGGSNLPSVRFEMNSYGAFVDQGVKGTDPVDSRHNGGRSIWDTPKGKFKKRKKSLPIKSVKAWAEQRGLNPYAVAKAVHKKGIARSLFFSKPFLKRYTKTINEYQEAVGLDIAHNIGNQIAKQLKNKTK